MFNDTTNNQCTHFNVSPKRLFGLNHIGKMLGERILKMGNLHGIRWQRSRQRPIRAFLADWRSATISLHEFGKRHAQQSLLGPYNRVYLSSPLAVYEGAQFRRHFVGHGMHVGTVVGVADLDAESKWLDVPALKLSYQDGHSEWLHVAQAIDCMEAGYQSPLMKSPAYELYCTSTSARCLCSLAFLYDVRSITARLSETCQRNGLLVRSVNAKCASVIQQLRDLLETRGPREAAFMSSYDPERELVMGLGIVDWEAGQEALAVDKRTYLEALMPNLDARVPFRGPLNEARAVLFDHTAIPVGNEEEAVVLRGSHGNNEARFFARQYADLFAHLHGAPLTVPEVESLLISDWCDFKARVNSTPAWQQMPPGSLNSMVFRTCVDSLPFYCHAQTIERASPLQTADDERYVSLQERLKTAYRNRLSDSVLNDQMFICSHGKPVDEMPSAFWHRCLAKWHSLKERGRYNGIWKADVDSCVR